MPVVLPAPAGVSPTLERYKALGECAPRTCGGKPNSTMSNRCPYECSPHLRG